MTRRYSVVDAFSGAGGLSLGMLAAGLDVLYSFDNDRLCVSTQQANPQYLKHTVECVGIEELLDVSVFDRIGLKRGQLFLLAGGPPCQGFSVQRIGSDCDDRNNLVMKYIELAGLLQPEYVLMENVPGLRGKRGRHVLESALGRLEQLGYSVISGELDAQKFGVPQRRRRIFVFAERDPVWMVPLTLPDLNCPRVTVRETIGWLPPVSLTGAGKDSEISLHRADRLTPINIQRLRALKEGQGREFLPKDLLATCHLRDAATIGHRNVYGRMSWDEVAPTITARFDSFTRGMFGHPEQIRSISLREGALLQTFPLDFAFEGNKVDIARQIGNAVPVKFAEGLGRHILKHHQKKLAMETGVQGARVNS